MDNWQLFFEIKSLNSRFLEITLNNKNVVEDDGFTEKLTEIEAILSSKI